MAAFKLIVGAVLGVVGFKYYLSTAKLPPATTESFEEICLHAGYLVQTHFVKTQDGYFLRLYRLSAVGKDFSSKNPVLLTHGLTHNAASFIINQSASPLAFTLADHDYDVWLLNTRGNHLSRIHETLSPKSAKFWDFTANEIAFKDLPAAIDFVKKTTDQPRLYYVGHSQGAISFMVMLMGLPEYNSSIKVAALLNPGCGLLSLKPFLFQLLTSRRTHEFLDLIHCYNAAEKSGLFLPRLFAKFPSLGAAVLKGTFSVSKQDIDPKYFPVYASHFSGGTSVKNLKYIRQLQDRKDPLIRKYDYGDKENLAVYGSAYPPAFDFNNITAKLAVFAAVNDALITPQDTEALLQRLPKESVVYLNKDLPLDHEGVLTSKDTTYQADILRVFAENS